MKQKNPSRLACVFWLLLVASCHVLGQNPQLKKVDYQALLEIVEEEIQGQRESLVLQRRAHYSRPSLPGEHAARLRSLRTLLQSIGYKVRQAGSSVYGTLRGALPGPTIGLRFELDAARVRTAPRIPRLNSQVPGVRHVWGNDAQMAIATVAAELFVSIQDRLPGTIRIIFEGDSSILEGAHPLQQADVMQNQPPLELLISLKMAPRPSGNILVHSGRAGGHGATFEIELSNRAGREQLLEKLGGLPAIPPIEAADFDPAQQTTAGSDKGPHCRYAWQDLSGQTIVPLVKGWIACAASEQLGPARQKIQAVVEAQDGARLRFPVTEIPPLVSDSEQANLAIEYLQDILPPESVQIFRRPVPHIFDDAGVLHGSASSPLILWLGVSNPERGIEGIPGRADFNIDEAALVTGLAVATKLPLRFMAERINALVH